MVGRQKILQFAWSNVVTILRTFHWCRFNQKPNLLREAAKKRYVFWWPGLTDFFAASLNAKEINESQILGLREGFFESVDVTDLRISAGTNLTGRPAHIQWHQVPEDFPHGGIALGGE